MLMSMEVFQELITIQAPLVDAVMQRLGPFFGRKMIFYSLGIEDNRQIKVPN